MPLAILRGIAGVCRPIIQENTLICVLHLKDEISSARQGHHRDPQTLAQVSSDL